MEQKTKIGLIAFIFAIIAISATNNNSTTNIVLSSVPSSVLSFDGVDDYVEFTPTGFPVGDAAHSVGGWIYPISLPPIRAWILLIGNADNGAHHWLINSAGGTQFGIWNGVYVNSALPIGQWTHIVITYDKTYLRSYVNGNLDQVIMVDTAKFNLANTFNLAKAQVGENFFNGLIDDVRIYNRTLSASEIANLYNGTYVNRSGLVLEMNMNEEIGLTSYDSSGYDNHGTLTNGVSWGYSYLPLKYNNNIYLNKTGTVIRE